MAAPDGVYEGCCKLNGPEGNQFGLGAKIKLEYQDQIQFQELTLTRGFQSSVEPIVHFGIGKVEAIDKVSITWPDGREQTLNNVSSNQLLEEVQVRFYLYHQFLR